MRPDPQVAGYLLTQCREEILRVFYLRLNEPLEFSQLRLTLEAAGVKADHPNDWGSLSSLLSQRGKGQMTEVVGRANAIAASRNDAKNSVLRLSSPVYAFAKMLAEKRGWPPPKACQAQAQQGVLYVG